MDNKEQKHYLYLITRDDGERYIGVTTNLTKRMYMHRSGWGNKNLAGREFSYTVLLEGTESEIYSVEDKYIQDYRCSLNIARGGNSGPSLSGEKHARAILTEKDVLEIKSMLNSGTSLKYSEIADLYRVKSSTIANISNNTAWYGVGPVVNAKRKPHKISDEDVAKVIELWIGGTTRKNISKITGVGETSVFEFTRDIIQDKKPTHGNGFDSGRVKKIVDVYTETKNVSRTAKELGISPTTVRKYLKLEGIL